MLRSSSMIAQLLKHGRDFCLQPLRETLQLLATELRQSRLEHLAASPRYADPRCLTRWGYRCSSQNDEDGIIDEIFRRIGTTNREFIEFGVQTGLENNTVALLLANWSGLWIEANPDATQIARREFSVPIREGRLRLTEAFVTAETIEELFQQDNVSTEPDLLSIDIDGNDYWVWKAIVRYRPRVIVIEYNANLGRSTRLVRPYDPAARWDSTMAYGASLGALEELGRTKGYALVGCNLIGVNAFFVRNDCLGERFLEPYTSVQHFEPPRFGVGFAGHRTRWARFDSV